MSFALTVEQSARILVRIADKDAKAWAELEFEAVSPTKDPGVVEPTATFQLPEQMRINGTLTDVVPSIIEVEPAGTTIKIDGQPSATFISNRCGAIGCSGANKQTIEQGGVAWFKTTFVTI